MKLPKYHSKIVTKNLSIDNNGFSSYDSDDISCRFNLLETAILTSCLGVRSCIAIDILDEIEPSLNKSISKSELVDCFQSLLHQGVIEEERQENTQWNAPLLIAGSARSGTSALARSLSTHPACCIFNEYRLYLESELGLDIWNLILGMRDDNSPPLKISDDVSSLRLELLKDLPLPASNRSTRDWLFGKLNGNVSEGSVSRHSQMVYGDKMPYAYLRNMRELIKQYPSAKYLITLRDGRAVIASQIRNFHKAIANGAKPEHWMKPSVQEAEYLWLRSAKIWLDLKSNSPVPYLEVRYEEAVKAPESLAKEISNFAGITYDSADFKQFIDLYRPVNVDSWREEIEDIDDQLSDEFKDALKQLAYD